MSRAALASALALCALALGAPPVHGAPPGAIYEVGDPHDFLNRSLERRNFITELLLGYDHYPHWDGDQCIVCRLGMIEFDDLD